MFDFKALETIINIARLSNEAKVLEPNAEPEGVYFIQKPTGEVEKQQAERPHRRHLVHDIPSMIVALSVSEEPVSIFYNSQKIVGFYNDLSRRESVTMELGYSPQMDELASIANALPHGVDYAQADLIRWMRITMGGCVRPSVIDSVRLVRFEQSQAVDSTVQRGKASISKTQQAELTNAQSLPESFLCTVPVFKNASLPFKADLRVMLEPDEKNSQFTLAMVPMDFEIAANQSEDRLGELINSIMCSLGKGFTLMGKKKQIAATQKSDHH